MNSNLNRYGALIALISTFDQCQAAKLGLLHQNAQQVSHQLTEGIFGRMID